MNVFNQGIDPQGNTLSNEMPWKKYPQLFPDEQLKDLCSCLHGLEPKASSQ